MTASDYAEEKESVVFCEGFHDRDFWAGWLPRLGWTDARVDGKCVDPWTTLVVGGEFGFAKNRRFVRVQECKGAQHVIEDALNRMKRRNVKALRHVIINLDSDATDDGVGPAERRLEGLSGKLRMIFGGTEPELLAPNSYQVDGVRVSAVIWRAEDHPETPGVPAKQTLERLVAASLAAADRDRAAGVDHWLLALPEAAVDGQKSILGKAYTWSYMAKWYPDRGRDGFYRLIWEDDKVSQQLERRLRASGAWAIGESL
jgi:hypothetical protein